ncbi:MULTISPECIES: hypothetical protein [Haloferax]|uniref:DUF7308 domain-containing protein n=1 Tax=Haloferax marinum TaxID=2666143 RepID=A0A6A8G379_9EURY|nr:MULTISPECIES: hypothetical protein [Haloferax]KAB1196620.1 hypothetical protein Hfx1150_03430 [Haloferax sp. CBA1150]MRW95624.1 hypothetical protein [Haloferax marinum]
MSGRPRVPWLYRVVRDRSGQASPLAVVLLLGITVLGTTAIVTLGGAALDDTKQASNAARAEHSMTLFDSKVAITALGDSQSQAVELSGSQSGEYLVREDSTRIVITHKDFDGNGTPQELYDAELGSVEYRTGDVTIAYEGGGVWRTQDNGTSMVSPPEFHYRDKTLTLPVIQVTGDGGTARSPTVDILEKQQANRIYPKPSEYYDNSSQKYVNPVENGTVEVTIYSPHYRGWAQFFEERTEGNMSLDHTNESVSVELEAIGGVVGNFRMPNEGGSIEVRGMADNHTVSSYTLNLTADNNFQNMHWSMYQDGSEEDVEFHVYADGQCKTDGSFDGDIDMSIYYSNQSGTYQGWQNSNIDPEDPSSMAQVDCSTDPATITLNLTHDSTNMTYGDITMTGSDNKWYFGPEIKENSANTTTNFTEHDVDRVARYEKGDNESLKHVTNHYMSLLSPKFKLTVTDGPGGSERVNEQASSGNLDYEQADGGRYITFLHITENRVEVRFR